MTTDARSRTTWRDHPATRILGSAFGWFSGALAITLLYQTASALSDLGGFCARGGPYEIAVECTDAIVVFAPTSIIGGLAAVFTGSLLAQGFGVSLFAFAWPALFVSLSVTFFRSFALYADWSGLIIAIMFFAMGIAPLILILRVAPQSTVLGRVDARGVAFWQPHPSKPHLLSLTRPREPGENHASVGDWVLSLGVALSASALGVWLGIVWFGAVA